MPDALNIVSRVLDEVTDADADSMDIDSGSGQNSKQTLEDTLAACVGCLFECLEPSATAARGWYPQSIISVRIY
jgi:proteasome component ECM29